jgi:hypothetical protein
LLSEGLALPPRGQRYLLHSGVEPSRCGLKAVMH